jgi:hypothetical protein
MVKIRDTRKYQEIWPEARDWIQSALTEIIESEIEHESLANALVAVAEAAYYTNVEDYTPGKKSLKLERLEKFNCPDIIIMPFLKGIKERDRHGYATAEIREYERAHTAA